MFILSFSKFVRAIRSVRHFPLLFQCTSSGYLILLSVWFSCFFLTKNIRAVCHKEIIRPYCLMAKDREKSTESLPIGEQEISVENSVENRDQNIGKDPMFSKTISEQESTVSIQIFKELTQSKVIRIYYLRYCVSPIWHNKNSVVV